MPSWSYSERKLLLKAQKGGLTSTPEPCPNPMEENDAMDEELRSQRRIGEDEISGRQNLNTDESIAL